MPNVYVVADRHLDIAKAQEWGDLIFLAASPYPKLQTAQMLLDFQEHMRQASPEDFLLLSGLSIMNAIAVGITVRKFSRCNLLIHSPLHNCYVHRLVEFV